MGAEIQPPLYLPSRVPWPEAARSKGRSTLTCIRVRCGLTDVLTSTPSALDWTALVVKKLLYTVKNTRENKTPKGLLLASSLHTHSYSLAGIPGWCLFLHLYCKSNISIRSSTHCESSRGSRKARTLTPLSVEAARAKPTTLHFPLPSPPGELYQKQNQNRSLQISFHLAWFSFIDAKLLSCFINASHQHKHTQIWKVSSLKILQGTRNLKTMG